MNLSDTPEQRHLFLDLEDTVIQPVTRGWDATELVNIPKVRAFIKEWRPTKVHLFSFALHNVHELSGFNRGTRAMLEEALGLTLQMTPTVDEDILPACCRLQRLSPRHTTFTEMVEFWGKQASFRMYVRQLHSKLMPRTSFEQKLTVALLDDAVFDEDFTWPTENISGQVRNVDML